MAARGPGGGGYGIFGPSGLMAGMRRGGSRRAGGMQMFQVYAPVFVLAGGLAYLLVVTLQQPPSQHLLHHRPSDTPHAATLFNHHPDPDANHGADPTAVAREQRRAPDTSFTVDESFTFPEVVPQGANALQKGMKMKYLSMQLNQGRLNNQLRSLDGAMRWAKALKRTLFIENPCLHINKESSDYDRCVHVSVLRTRPIAKYLKAQVTRTEPLGANRLQLAALPAKTHRAACKGLPHRSHMSVPGRKGSMPMLHVDAGGGDTLPPEPSPNAPPRQLVRQRGNVVSYCRGCARCGAAATTSRMVACKNQWMGFDQGLWDLQALREAFDFVLEEDIVRMYGSLDAHPVLGAQGGAPCKVGVEGLVQRGPSMGHCAHLYVECPGVFPWLAGSTEAHGVPRTSFLDLVRPGKYLQTAAQEYLDSIQKPLPYPFVTVHLRTFEESIRYETKDILERQRRAKKHCSEVIGRQTRGMPENPLDPYMLEFCNLTEVSINLALTNAKIAPLTPSRPFFFAGSDELDDSPVVKTLKSLGASKFDYKEFLRRPADQGGSHQTLVTEPADTAVFQRRSCAINEGALMDMYILTKGDFFIGNPSSTFSQMVCILRGREKAAQSNMCVWQLQKYGLLPMGQDVGVPLPLLDTQPAQEDALRRTRTSPGEESPQQSAPETAASPTKPVTSAWQWSNNKQFVMLDAYIYAHNPSKNSLLILGDGKLPMKYHTATSYEADLVCDFGGGIGKVPAKVLLMSGGKVTERGYLYDEPEKSWPQHLWPLSIAQNMHTSYITCPLPMNIHRKQLQSQTRKDGIRVSNSDGDFVLNVDPMKIVEPPEVLVPPPGGPSMTSVHCLCPVYSTGVSGFKQRDPRLLLEWLVHHKTAGFTHVHAYMQDYTDPVSQKVLEHFANEGFLTVHDWGKKPSEGITEHTYQKAKYLAMADCWLRSRGVADFMAVGDLDEFIHFQQPMGTLLSEFHAAYKASNQQTWAFSISSKTVLPFMTPEEEKDRSSLLIDLLDVAEKKCKAPFNCGAYHRGRQKYFFYTKNTGLPIVLPWTHAISRNYTWADQVHQQIGEQKLFVRHYSGQWFQDGLPASESAKFPFPEPHLAQIRSAIGKTPFSQQIYKASEPSGRRAAQYVGVRPVDRPQTARQSAEAGAAGAATSTNAAKAKQYKHLEQGPFECSLSLAKQQATMFFEAKRKNWRFTSCADAKWLSSLPQVWTPKQLTLVDIGCNKGYTSARLFATFASQLGLNAKTLHKTLQSELKSAQFSGGLCGVCGDCNEDLPPETPSAWPVPNIHCIEPSPATFKLLSLMRTRFSAEHPEVMDHWHQYNLGMADIERTLMFEGPVKEPTACQQAGQETCMMTDEASMTGSGTVFVNGSSVAGFMNAQNLEQVDVLKIDAEGHDPMVLDGAYSVLGGDRVRVVMFEYHGIGRWKSEASLQLIVEKLDVYGWDCYLDGAPEMTRLTRCWVPELEFRWWSNVVCFKRDNSGLADTILNKHTFPKFADLAN